MNEFAGSITFKGKVGKVDLPFKCFPHETKDGNTTIFCMGETEISASKELVEDIVNKINGIMLAMDISISTEDNIRLVRNEIPENTGGNKEYVLKSVAGNSFESTVWDADKANLSIIAIREAEKSISHGGRVVKIDTIV